LLNLNQSQITNDIIKNNATIKNKIEKIIGKSISSLSQYKENGSFSFSSFNSPISYNNKSCQYAGILFLTPNAPITSGITLYRPKSTKTLLENEYTSTNWKTTDLEAVDIVGNVYNRLVIFNAKMIHSASHHFGNTTENGRLVQTFAFDLAETKQILFSL